MASGNTLLTFHPFRNEAPATLNALADLRNSHPILAFNDTTAWFAIFSDIMPQNYSGGGLTVIVYWMAVAVAGTAGWTIEIERGELGVLDHDADSFATAQTVVAATVPGTSGMVFATQVVIPAGAAMDNLLSGEPFRMRVGRDVANDNAAGDTQILGVEVREA